MSAWDGCRSIPRCTSRSRSSPGAPRSLRRPLPHSWRWSSDGSPSSAAEQGFALMSQRESRLDRPAGEEQAADMTTLRYCVIGAGAAGLATLDALLEAGFDVDCF